jgi:hydroxymethylglutaryl-CoA lyase
MNKHLKIIECPRDAMQGLKAYIPTQTKIDYINQLLKVGFDTLDMGSFVAPHAIPQMADTALVLSNIKWEESKSKLLCIVANNRGAMEASQFEQVSYMGFPFSISETFQQRNTNSSIEQSLITVEKIQGYCSQTNKEAVVYISMGFGNPYGDIWNAEIVLKWIEKIIALDVKIISLADTIGIATPESISNLIKQVINEFPTIEVGAHLHTTQDTWKEKIDAAFKSGCRRIDGAIKGFGGCPMATDSLTGNMATENIIKYLNDNNINHGLDEEEFGNSVLMSGGVFDHEV